MKKFAFALIIFGLICVAAPRAFAQQGSESASPRASSSASIGGSGWTGTLSNQLEGGSSGSVQQNFVGPSAPTQICGWACGPITQSPKEGIFKDRDLHRVLGKYCNFTVPTNTTMIGLCGKIESILRAAQNAQQNLINKIRPLPHMPGGPYLIISVGQSPRNADDAWITAVNKKGHVLVYSAPMNDLPMGEELSATSSVKVIVLTATKKN